jgi:hypothetical protein
MKKSKWQLQDAKDGLSEVVLRARKEGPQTITVHETIWSSWSMPRNSTRLRADLMAA